jgi:hypothetical protein
MIRPNSNESNYELLVLHAKVEGRLPKSASSVILSCRLKKWKYSQFLAELSLSLSLSGSEANGVSKHSIRLLCEPNQ